MRKSRANKRSNLKPLTPSMASSPSSTRYTSYYYYYRKVYLFIPVFLLIVATIFLWSISSNAVRTLRSVSKSDQLYTIEVVNEFPHDPKAFTQGLLYGGNDTLFESTGLYQHSSVRRVVLQTGKIVSLQKMDKSYFGEGLTLLDESS